MKEEEEDEKMKIPRRNRNRRVISKQIGILELHTIRDLQYTKAEQIM